MPPRTTGTLNRGKACEIEHGATGQAVYVEMEIGDQQFGSAMQDSRRQDFSATEHAVRITDFNVVV